MVWALIVVLFYGQQTTSTISGFSSEKSCNLAGDQVAGEFRDKFYLVETFCVEVK